MTSKWRHHLLVASLFACVGAIVAYRAQIALHAGGSDLFVTWQAVRAIASRQNPYDVVRPSVGSSWSYWYYPLPAALLVAPVAWLSPAGAALVFVTASCGILGFALSRRDLPWFPVLVSVPFWFGAQLAQMAPLVVALGLLPAVAGLSLLKPNLGLALLAWRPSWRTITVAAVVVLVSVLFFPHWPRDWLEIARRSVSHSAPVTRGVGFVGLLAIARWRRPEARLLFTMTLAPNAVWFYDELPLFLIARDSRDAVLLCAGSWLAWVLWMVVPTVSGKSPTTLNAGPWITLAMYLPATVMVIARPNEGPLPQWLEQGAQWLPTWLRGKAGEIS